MVVTVVTLLILSHPGGKCFDTIWLTKVDFKCIMETANFII